MHRTLQLTLHDHQSSALTTGSSAVNGEYVSVICVYVFVCVFLCLCLCLCPDLCLCLCLCLGLYLYQCLCLCPSRMCLCQYLFLCLCLCLCLYLHLCLCLRLCVYSECVRRNTEKKFKSSNSMFFTFMACADISVSHLEREQEKARARELVFKPLQMFRP